MTEDQSTYPASGIAQSRLGRCLIGALFTAGVVLAIVNLLGMAPESKQPYLFFLILGIAFVGGQIQERMRRMST